MFGVILGLLLGLACQPGADSLSVGWGRLRRPPRMAATEAPSRPVPKVPSSAWRFPPVWPFPADFTERVDNPGSPAEVVSEESVERLARHLRAFVSDGEAVLEIASEPTSLLPRDVALAKTERYLLDEQAVTSRDFELPFASQSFDHVSLSSGIQYLVEPKELFREVWRVLRPGGKCFVSFLSRFPGSELRPARMWTTMNEEQKIWIVGSYFFYSAEDGWSGIEGFDLFSESTQELIFEKQAGRDVHAYVVQATKTPLPDMAASLGQFVALSLCGCKNMESEDKKYNVSFPSSAFCDGLIFLRHSAWRPRCVRRPIRRPSWSCTLDDCRRSTESCATSRTSLSPSPSRRCWRPTLWGSGPTRRPRWRPCGRDWGSLRAPTTPSGPPLREPPRT